MYERGSEQWHDLSYGSGASYPSSTHNGAYTAAYNGSPNGSSNGSPNGSSNGSGPDHVWYRTPSGEDATAPAPAYQAPAPAYQPPAPAFPLTQTQPPAPAYSAYESTSYEAAYAPAATQSFPATPAPAAGTDVTTYDPATGLPMAGDAVIYPMRNVAGRMSMILGVFAILFTSVLFPLFPLAFLFGFGAIMLGRRGRLRARFGFASNPGSAGGGFALGVIAMVLAVIWTAAAAWLFTSYSATDLQNCIKDTHNGPEAIRCIADVVDAA